MSKLQLIANEYRNLSITLDNTITKYGTSPSYDSLDKQMEKLYKKAKTQLTHQQIIFIFGNHYYIYD